MDTNENTSESKLMKLATELERQKETKKDYIVDSRSLQATNKDGVIHLDLIDLQAEQSSFPLTGYAHKQLAEKCKIPARYYDRMRTEGKADLLQDNINAWIQDKDQRMIRTLDGKARAILSDRYKIMDNYDVLFMALEQLREFGADVQAAELTETNLYLKATVEMEEFVDPQTRDDPLKRGIIIRNSEVGAGAFKVEPFLLRLICSNGLIGEHTINRVHLGRKREAGEIFTQDTRDLEDKALWSGIRVTIRATFDPELFQDWMTQIRRAKDAPIHKPIEAMDWTVKRYDLNQDMKDRLLGHFTRDRIAGPTVWGIANSITAAAQETESYDRQIQLEEIGNKVLTDKALLLMAESGEL